MFEAWLGISLFGFGLMLGWLLREWWVVGRLERDLIKNRAEAKRFDQFAAEMRETDVSSAASNALTDLDLLVRLEEERNDDAKKLLIYKLSLFYNRWSSKPETHSKNIQDALSQIREAAKEFKSVQVVLTVSPDVQ